MNFSLLKNYDISRRRCFNLKWFNWNKIQNPSNQAGTTRMGDTIMMNWLELPLLKSKTIKNPTHYGFFTLPIPTSIPTATPAWRMLQWMSMKFKWDWWVRNLFLSSRTLHSLWPWKHGHIVVENLNTVAPNLWKIKQIFTSGNLTSNPRERERERRHCDPSWNRAVWLHQKSQSSGYFICKYLLNCQTKGLFARNHTEIGPKLC